jgi:ATP phosphoribosyltransferase
MEVKMKPVLKLAIQRKGRLSEGSLELLRDCGITFSRSNGKLKVFCDNFPLQILFLRDDDIPAIVAGSVADLGIVGRNLLVESRAEVQPVRDLGFARCRLAVAVEKTRSWAGLDDLEGKWIATSHPRILADFLERRGVNARIRRIAGSVEIAPAIGMAEAVCDLVSSGSTLLSNGLREVETVFQSSAQLVATPELPAQKSELLERLLLRIQAVLRARTHKYILLNAPELALEEICRLLPGMKSPTVSRLNQPGWVSVQSVVKEEEFWEMVDRLHEMGAEGILVLGLEKMVF